MYNDVDTGWVRVYVYEVDAVKELRRVQYMDWDSGSTPWVEVTALKPVDDDPGLFHPMELFERRKYDWESADPTWEERQQTIYDFSRMMNKGERFPLYDRHQIRPSWIRNVQAQLVEFYLLRRAKTKHDYMKCIANKERSESLLLILQSFHDACTYLLESILSPSVKGVVSIALFMLPCEYFIDAKMDIKEPVDEGAAAYKRCFQQAMEPHHTSDHIDALGVAIDTLERLSGPVIANQPPKVQERVQMFLSQVTYLKTFRQRHLETVTNLQYNGHLAQYVATVRGSKAAYAQMEPLTCSSADAVAIGTHASLAELKRYIERTNDFSEEEILADSPGDFRSGNFYRSIETAFDMRWGPERFPITKGAFTALPACLQPPTPRVFNPSHPVS